MWVRPRLAILVAIVGSASCAKCRSEQPAPAPAASASSSAVPATTGRCVLKAPPVRWGGSGDDAGEEPVAFGAEIGGAAADANAFYLGARASGGNGAVQVLRIALAGGAPTAITTLANVRSAPAVAVGEGRVIIAGLENQADFRVLHVIKSDNGAIGDVAQAKDESEFGAIVPTPSGALAVWDDVLDKEHRGRIRVRVLPSTIGVPDGGADAGTGDDGVISPATSDAAWPVVVASPKGDRALVLWLAEKPEAESDGGGEPSQAEAFRWVEAIVVDVASGKPLGSARALTSQSGHAQTVAAAWVDGGFVAVVRDDPRPTDGDGGELIAVKVPVDASSALGEPARASVAEKDVAPGVAYVLARGAGALVSYLGPDGDAHLVPVFGPGAATIESALESRRIVASVHEAGGDSVLATKLAGSAVELAIARCAP
ncbi:MAG: hypothetical protein ACXWUE_24675 [Polyangiales bacterium]